MNRLAKMAATVFLAIGCDSKYDFHDSYRGEIDLPLDSTLYVSIMNSSVTSRNVQLFVQTQLYPCLGYRLVYEMRKNDRKLELFIDGIDKPDDRCLTALGPAEKGWDLFLLEGTYNWLIEANGELDRFEILISDTAADLVQLDSNFTRIYQGHISL